MNPRDLVWELRRQAVDADANLASLLRDASNHLHWLGIDVLCLRELVVELAACLASGDEPMSPSAQAAVEDARNGRTW